MQNSPNSVGLVKPHKVHFDEELMLASGSSLNGFDLVYETYGKLNPDCSNAILICHALSGDHHVAAAARQSPLQTLRARGGDASRTEHHAPCRWRPASL